MLLEDFDKIVLIEVCCSYDSSVQLPSDFSFEIQTMHSTIYMKSPFDGLLGKSNLTCPEHNSRFLHLYHPQTSALVRGPRPIVLCRDDVSFRLPLCKHRNFGGIFCSRSPPPGSAQLKKL